MRIGPPPPPAAAQRAFELALAEDESGEALEGLARAQLPIELAWTRLELAGALAEGSSEVAIAEAKFALQDFERLEATRHADAAWMPRRGTPAAPMLKAQRRAVSPRRHPRPCPAAGRPG